MKLTRGMFGGEFEFKDNLFCRLRCGQMRPMDQTLLRNAGWYNKAGEKLGFGDISYEDALRITTELEEGEYFVLLPEDSSFWRFVEQNPGTGGPDCQTNPSIDAPGVAYTASQAEYIIGRNLVMKIHDGDQDLPPRRIIGCPIHVDQITRATAQLLLVAGEPN